MTTPDDTSDRSVRRQRGRPRVPDHERRTHLIGVFVNEGELAELRRRGEATGMTDLATYLRRAVLAQRAPRAVVPEINRGAWAELARTTANVNQIAAHLNGGGRFDERGTPRLAEALDALRAEVRALRLTLTEPTGSDGDEDEDEGDEA